MNCEYVLEIGKEELTSRRSSVKEETSCICYKGLDVSWVESDGVVGAVSEHEE